MNNDANMDNFLKLNYLYIILYAFLVVRKINKNFVILKGHLILKHLVFAFYIKRYAHLIYI